MKHPYLRFKVINLKIVFYVYKKLVTYVFKEN